MEWYKQHTNELNALKADFEGVLNNHLETLTKLEQVAEQVKELEYYKNRGFWKRIFNIKYKDGL